MIDPTLYELLASNKCKLEIEPNSRDNTIVIKVIRILVTSKDRESLISDHRLLHISPMGINANFDVVSLELRRLVRDMVYDLMRHR